MACAACGAAHAADAQFCGDCGAEIGRDCPACGYHVGLGDFCEGCGHWMHEGKCRFCYALLADGAAFCEECGCNQAGLVCTRCNTRSFFDFCGGCGTALSERAVAALQALPSPDPALAAALADMQAAQQEAQALMGVPAAGPPAATAKPRQRLLSGGAAQALRAMGDTTSAAVAGAVPLEQMRIEGDPASLASQASFEDLKSRRRLRLTRERAQQLLEEMGRQIFVTGQAARVHAMALRQILIDDGYVPRAWRCNRYSCEHSTPNGCSAPQFGGVWLLEPPSHLP